ncbi:DDE-type integrase/transposase/recombinase (plasmid) [Deinococcus altitudinis]
MVEELRHREPRRGSRWLLDEICTTVDGVRHWLWRAVNEHGFVQGILLQRHRDTEAAKISPTRLLCEYDVPDTICTDQLRSYGAAIREIPSLVNVDHQQVISTARCNNMIEQRASVVIGAVLPKTPTSTIIPVPASPHQPEDNIRTMRFRRGLRLQQGWPEVLATPALSLP